MNEVYKSDTMCVHDDREPITLDQAFDILMAGKSITVCDPPDFTAEHECDIYQPDFYMWLSDVLSPETMEKINARTDDQIRNEMYENLRGYELYK